MTSQLKPLFLIASVCLFVFVSAFAGDKKDKVAIIHNGHVIVVAPEAVPAHLRHGDVLVTNDITITIINHNPDVATVTGPGSVPSGASATFDIVANQPCTFSLMFNSVPLFEGALLFDPLATSFTFNNVTDPLVVDAYFTPIVFPPLGN